MRIPYYLALLCFAIGSQNAFSWAQSQPTLSPPTLDIPFNKQLVPIARAGQQYSWTFLIDSFGSASLLNYSLSNNPSWLTLDSATRTFGGIPLASDVGTFTIDITATDILGQTSGDSFLLLVVDNQAPVVTNPVASQLSQSSEGPSAVTPSGDLRVYNGESFSIVFASNTCTDPDSIQLTYTAWITNMTSLPSWLSFDKSARNLSGVVPNNQPSQTLQVQIDCSDYAGYGGSDSSFNLTVSPHLLSITNPIPDQNVPSTIPVVYMIPNNTFTVDNMTVYTTNFSGQISSLTVSTAPNTPVSLPSWLTFNESTWTFTGTPARIDPSVTIYITVTSVYGSVAHTFFSFLIDGHPAPIIFTKIPDMAVTANTLFDFTIPTELVLSADPLNSTLTFSVVYTPQNTSSWLKFFPENETFRGIPPSNAFPNTTITLQITDAVNKSTTTTFHLVVNPSSASSPNFIAIIVGVLSAALAVALVIVGILLYRHRQGWLMRDGVRQQSGSPYGQLLNGGAQSEGELLFAPSRQMNENSMEQVRSPPIIPRQPEPSITRPRHRALSIVSDRRSSWPEATSELRVSTTVDPNDYNYDFYHNDADYLLSPRAGRNSTERMMETFPGGMYDIGNRDGFGMIGLQDGYGDETQDQWQNRWSLDQRPINSHNASDPSSRTEIAPPATARTYQQLRFPAATGLRPYYGGGSSSGSGGSSFIRDSDEAASSSVNASNRFSTGLSTIPSIMDLSEDSQNKSDTGSFITAGSKSSAINKLGDQSSSEGGSEEYDNLTDMMRNNLWGAPLTIGSTHSQHGSSAAASNLSTPHVEMQNPFASPTSETFDRRSMDTSARRRQQHLSVAETIGSAYSDSSIVQLHPHDPFFDEPDSEEVSNARGTVENPRILAAPIGVSLSYHIEPFLSTTPRSPSLSALNEATQTNELPAWLRFDRDASILFGVPTEMEDVWVTVVDESLAEGSEGRVLDSVVIRVVTGED